MNDHMDYPVAGLLAGAMGLMLLAAASGCSGASAGQTSIATASRTLPAAPLGPANPWPRFRFQLHESPVRASANLSEEDRAGMFTNAVVSPMPYLMQDGYTRQRQSSAVPTVEMQNDRLRAVFYPGLGGRMISLFDKRLGRELLFDNPVLQFANLAIRNAWFSGGVEWNGPLYGHSLLTCSPVFAATVSTPRGPLLRLYEFDRALETTWQVDLFLPGGDDRLWAHVKAINPGEREVRFYWWTNIAVPLEKKTRVLSPADYALSHGAEGNTRLPFPRFESFDGSYPFNYPSAHSIFFRKPGATRPWSACVDGDGRGISHVSTARLFGRKFFTWGMGRGGKRWMDFLSEDGKGDYIEIQGGVTPTQLQTVALAAGASIEWTECLGSLGIEPRLAHDPDYAAACAAAQKVIDQRVPESAMKEMDAFLASQSSAAVEKVLCRGSAWGSLHEKRTGRRISPGLDFSSVIGDEERPWAELLADGTFSAKTLSEQPRSFAVSLGWQDTLVSSAKKHGSTWLHRLHLGVAKLEEPSFAEARELLESSIKARENAMALRCLALIEERQGDAEAARAAYERAWALSGSDPALAVEVGEFLLRRKLTEGFTKFIESLPPAAAQHERIVLMKARAALAKGDYAKVRQLLQEREFSTIREGELSLSDLWFATFFGEAKARLGREPNAAEKEEIRRKNPPPRAIDFRMS